MASKAKQATDGVGNAMKLAKKYKAKVLFGTDMIFSKEARLQQAKELTVRKRWFSSPEIMIQATGNAGEALYKLTGKRNPYGRVGVIEPGAMADVVIFSKNFMQDVSIVEDAESNLKLIIKDGKVYKNTL
jgi:imidazolonepropionase-like amidohydrolase